MWVVSGERLAQDGSCVVVVVNVSEGHGQTHPLLDDRCLLDRQKRLDIEVELLVLTLRPDGRSGGREGCKRFGSNVDKGFKNNAVVRQRISEGMWIKGRGGDNLHRHTSNVRYGLHQHGSPPSIVFSKAAL